MKNYYKKGLETTAKNKKALICLTREKYENFGEEPGQKELSIGNEEAHKKEKSYEQSEQEGEYVPMLQI